MARRTSLKPATLRNALMDAARVSPVSLDVEKIRQAWEFAELAHTGQKRKSGEEFMCHPGQTALTLVEWKLDTDAVVAGLLHDTIEDGGATRNDLVKEFGEDVAKLVDGVTKISAIRLKQDSEAEFVENLRKMILVMAKDLRVVLVKLADRYHNMQTLDALPPPKRLRFARETLEIYAPLAERLGMGLLKGELEDLAFPHVYPNEYAWVKKLSAPYYTKAKTITQKMRRRFLTALRQAGVETVWIGARAKYFYSLYRKLLRPEYAKDMTKIHDVVAIRIIVKTVEECYITLGLVHRLFRPTPQSGVRDFIATPKPNGYRSIHTNVFGPRGTICEVQIRTQAMHDEAEMGFAAHWHYAEAKKSGASDAELERGVFAPKEKTRWIKQLANWQKQITDKEEYLRALKFDALQHRNLVFSPRGDVYDLPKGATAVDFAYAVHTNMGHQAVGAKVNGKLVPLNHKLDNGDIVEIRLDRNRTHPNADWVGFVVTTTARHAIRRALKHQSRFSFQIPSAPDIGSHAKRFFQAVNRRLRVSRHRAK